MKNLLCIALFSVALLVNAAEEKEIVINDVSVIKDSDFNNETFDDFADCGEEGNLEYHLARQAGYNHRVARRLRRSYVRDCRGGTWAWIGVCVGFIGHCD